MRCLSFRRFFLHSNTVNLIFMKRTEWFNRIFAPIEDNGLLPSIIERLTGTPARLKETLSSIKPSVLLFRIGDTWTINEEVGHLSDLEPLWYGRLEDLLRGEKLLRVTDLTNQLTSTSNHNATEIDILIHRFRERRKGFVNRLRELSDPQLLASALHPRLLKPMRIIDLAYFVAEHDDHHLARIREIADREDF